jgi:EAL domain-containing protein (putative c-di-GMP-specific phosphodiesterase class I)
VVAEGVEEPDQLDRLRADSCDLAQGYLLSRPLSAVDAAAFGEFAR